MGQLMETCGLRNPDPVLLLHSGNVIKVKQALDAGVDVNEYEELLKCSIYSNTALMSAAKSGKKEIVEILINAKADVNLQPKLVVNTHPEIVNTMFTSNEYFHNKGETALWYATMENHPEIVRLLLDAKADANATKTTESPTGSGCICVSTALSCAVKNGATEIVKMLIDAGADVNTTGYFVTVRVKQHPKQNNLLYNIDLQHINDYTSAESVLMSAARKGPAEIVQILVNAGADANATYRFFGYKNQQRIVGDSYGNALTLAAQYNQVENVKILMNAKSDVNIKQPEGAIIIMTSLMHGSSNGNKEIVQLLIDAKADIRIQNRDGKTALMLAVEKDHKEIIHMLKDD